MLPSNHILYIKYIKYIVYKRNADMTGFTAILDGYVKDVLCEVHFIGNTVTSEFREKN